MQIGFYIKRIFFFPLLITLIIFSTGCSRKANQLPNPVAGGPVTDIDGNVYKTVVIGNQVWMAENLRVTRYNNGDQIPGVSDSSWVSLTTGAYCYYNNDSARNRKSYGALYNWYALPDSRGLAPAGWHIPSDEDWTILTKFLGGDSIAAIKLKETGKTHWLSPNATSTNQTGFTALPGGSIYGSKGFTYLGNYGYWWSSTEQSSATGWFRGMYFSSSVFRNYSAKSNGYSVRCIKN